MVARPAWLLVWAAACAPPRPGAVVDGPSPSARAMPVAVTRACLSAPVDLTLDPGGAPPTSYVDDIRLGYSRVGAVYLSRPLCEMHGDALCRFVEAHEKAHHYTRTIGPSSRCAEVLADCWAAIHSDDEALDAAIAFFSSRRGARGQYDEPRERARTVIECAALRDRRQQMARPTVPAVPAEPATPASERRTSSAELALAPLSD